MNINEVRTKLMRHDHLTIKQDDTGSVVELALYDAAGTILKSVHGSCTVTLRNVNTGAVNLTKTAAITNGELSFTIDKHLEASPHTLEIVTSDGKRFPANGNFVVDITKSHKTAIVEIIKNITREEAIRDVTKAVTEYVHSHANTFRGEKGDKGDAATITENKVLSDGSISLTFSDKTVVIIPKGVKGDRGATGPKGEQGVKGDTGPKGETGAKGNKGDRGDDLAIDGVVDSVDSLPDGTTASNYLVGDDLYFRVAGQSKWQKGLTLKNEVTIKDGFFYIDGKKTTAAANESQAIEYAKKYVQSRGQNLVTNGYGTFMNNTNFGGFTFRMDDVKVGVGSFYTKETKPMIADEVIAIDTSNCYEYSMWVKSDNGKARSLLGLRMLDADLNSIAPNHVTTFEDDVTLTKPLKEGDQEVHVSDASPWLSPEFTRISRVSQGIILWGYTDNKGRQYAKGTYSRHACVGIDKVDAETNVIYLTSPISFKNTSAKDGVFQVGHAISRTWGGSSHNYSLANKDAIASEWAKLSEKIQGESGDISDMTSFRHGTVYVQPYIYPNREASDGLTFCGVSLKEVPSERVSDPQKLVLQNGFTGSVTCVKDVNNLVTLKYNVVIGEVSGMGTVISSLPREVAPTEYVPSLGQNPGKGVVDSFLYITPSAELKMLKGVAKGDNLQGQVTYRVEG